jgi:hypothetical protein
MALGVGLVSSRPADDRRSNARMPHDAAPLKRPPVPPLQTAAPTCRQRLGEGDAASGADARGRHFEVRNGGRAREHSRDVAGALVARHVVKEVEALGGLAGRGVVSGGPLASQVARAAQSRLWHRSRAGPPTVVLGGVSQSPAVGGREACKGSGHARRPTLSADVCTSSSLTALQACTLQPTFCSDRNSRPSCRGVWGKWTVGR